MTSSKRNNNKGHTDNTQVSLGTTLLLLPWSSSEWQVEHFISFCGIYFGVTTAILTTLDSGTNIFAKVHFLSELETIIGTSTVSDLSFTITLATALNLFHRETEWMTKEELSDKC